jgi:type II secretory pathway pseudopilin PulG
MRSSRINKQKGLSIIEILGVLIIAGIVIGAALSRFQTAQEKLSVSEGSMNLQELFINIDEHFNGTDPNGILDNTYMVDAGLFPRGIPLDESTGVARNAFKGNILIDSPSSFVFTVEYEDVNEKQSCITLIQSQSAVGWTHYETSGNGTEVEFDVATPPDYTASCSPSTGSTVDVTFKYID